MLTRAAYRAAMSGKSPTELLAVIDDESSAAGIESLIGETLVLDMASRYVVLGTLDRVSPSFFVLRDADVHDLRDTPTTRDMYVLDARQHGISVGRVEVWIRIDEVVALSRLTDVAG